MKAQDINISNFQEVVLNSSMPVLVDFWAPWCGPCRMMAPILDELASDNDLNSLVSIVKVNTEEQQNQSLAMEYNIRSIPNMKLFFNGEVIEDFVGLRPKEQLKSDLLSIVSLLDINPKKEKDKKPHYSIKRFYNDHLAHASYMILSKGKAVLVDPGRDPKQYYEFADNNNSEIIAVFETHPHADFISSHLQISKEKVADIYISKIAKAKYPHKTFDDGDIFEFGDLVMRAINTPGHSPDSITLQLNTIDGETIALFTGDTLFIGDVGRPDLRELAGSITQQREILAEKMYNSIFDKLLKFDDDVKIFPAHGNGSLCGKNLSDKTESTIGEEKKINTAILKNDKDSFVKYLLNDQPYIPKYFTHAVQMNLEGADDFKKVLPRLFDRKSYSTLKDSDIVIDIRDKQLFDSNHISGAINIQFDGKFETWLGTILEPDQKYYLVIGKNLLIDVVRRIASIGYEENIAGVISEDQPFQSRVPVYSLPKEVEILEKHYQIVDVRKEDEATSNKYFDNSINIPLHELINRVEELDIDKPIIVHCEGGYRSQLASSIIRRSIDQEVVDLGSDILSIVK